MIVWFKPFSASTQRKLTTAPSCNDALGLNATVPIAVSSGSVLSTDPSRVAGAIDRIDPSIQPA